MDVTKLYFTSDLGVAAMLQTKGFKLALIDRKNEKRIKFGFVNDGNIESFVDAYADCRCEVDAYTMHSNIKSLKLRLFNNVEEE